MKIKILIGVLVFLILINLATIGSFLWMLKRGKPAERFHRDFSKRHTQAPFAGERPMRQIRPELRNHLRDDFRKLNRETRDLRANIHDLESQAFSLMQQDPVPIERVDSLLEEISRAQLAISKMATRNMIETRSQFTPEEREIFFKALLSSRPDMPAPLRRGLNRDDRERKHRQRSLERHLDSLQH